MISHSAVDFLATEIKMHGQALLDIPSIKLLTGCDGKYLQETQELYNLTDREPNCLKVSGEVTKCLLSAQKGCISTLKFRLISPAIWKLPEDDKLQ